MLEVVHTYRTEQDPGFVAVLVPNDLNTREPDDPRFVDDFNAFGPPKVWMNVWTTDNMDREEVGISYCDLLYVDKERASLMETFQDSPDESPSEEDTLSLTMRDLAIRGALSTRSPRYGQDVLHD